MSFKKITDGGEILWSLQQILPLILKVLMKARQVQILPPVWKNEIAKQLALNEFSWQWLLIDIGWHWMLPPANSLTWLPADIQLAAIEPQFNRIVQVHKIWYKVYRKKIKTLSDFFSHWYSAAGILLSFSWLWSSSIIQLLDLLHS